ncbi:pentatricopeptide repeat-containing protein [Tanacetum coccineum]
MPVKDETAELELLLWEGQKIYIFYFGRTERATALFGLHYPPRLVTCTAVISGYASNGDVEAARKMSDQMGNKRNTVTWNAMIAGYVNESIFHEALSLFHLMLLDGKCTPDQITLISVISACSHLGSLENGKWISAYINKNKIELSTL